MKRLRGVWVVFVALAAGPGWAQRALVDDFEGPNFNDAGWSVVGASPMRQLLSGIPDAGLIGRGARLVDAESGAGAGATVWLYKALTAGGGDQSVRFWFRPTFSNKGGWAHITQVLGNINPVPTMGEVIWDSAASTLRVSCFEDGNGTPVAQVVGGADAGDWHLVELRVSGATTAQGGCAVAIDGNVAFTSRALNFAGANIEALQLGEAYGDLPLLATLDFDAYRSSPGPLASTISLNLPATATAGDCVPVTAQLFESFDGGSAKTESLLPLTLNASPALAALTPGCLSAMAGLSIAPASRSVTFAVRPTVPGSYSLSASNLDLISEPANLNVAAADGGGTGGGGGSGGGAGGGGSTGGGAGGGGAGGSGGGATGGGPGTGGGAGGIGSPGVYAVGCGCQTLDFGAFWLLPLLLATAWRRTRAARARSCRSRPESGRARGR